jgi:hypothetical protein
MCDGRIQNTNCENVIGQCFHCSRFKLNFLCDLHILLGLSYLMPLLEVMNAIIKFAQGGDVFICDFVTTIKICQTNFYMVYSNP